MKFAAVAIRIKKGSDSIFRRTESPVISTEELNSSLSLGYSSLLLRLV